jgi:purine nucleosidase
MHSYTIVTDPGVDDLIAFLLLSKLTKEPQTLVSTYGNVPLEHTARNAEEFIAFQAPHWSHFRGASEPIHPPLRYPWPKYYHGPDGAWGVHPDVSIDDVKQLSALPSAIHVISVSPMTNTLQLAQLGNIQRLTIMGGAFNVPGNETPLAETNVIFDADASAETLKACVGADIQFIPLDVTNKVFWTRDQVEAIPESTPQGRWAKQLLLAWFAGYGDAKSAPFYLYDVLAVYSEFFPDRLTWQHDGVQIHTEGEKRGQTVFSATGVKCSVAVDAHNGAAIAQHMFELMFGIRA